MNWLEYLRCKPVNGGTLAHVQRQLYKGCNVEAIVLIDQDSAVRITHGITGADVVVCRTTSELHSIVSRHPDAEFVLFRGILGDLKSEGPCSPADLQDATWYRIFSISLEILALADEKDQIKVFSGYFGSVWVPKEQVYIHRKLAAVAA